MQGALVPAPVRNYQSAQALGLKAPFGFKDAGPRELRHKGQDEKSRMSRPPNSYSAVCHRPGQEDHSGSLPVMHPGDFLAEVVRYSVLCASYLTRGAAKRIAISRIHVLRFKLLFCATCARVRTC
ncbi:hypothetical protein D3C72_1852850 [compost metagenome]